MPQQTITPLERLLNQAQTTDDVRANAWDAFHAATDPDDFVRRFGSVSLPDNVKADLWDLKFGQQQAPSTPAQAAEQATSIGPTSFGSRFTAELRRNLRLQKEGAVGAAKGLGRSVVGAAQAVTSVPGVASALELPTRVVGQPVDIRRTLKDLAASPTLTAQTPAERIGMMGEQVAEFFALPTGKGSLARKAATQAAGAGTLSAAQGGSPVAGAVLGAAGPVVGKGLSTAGPRLQEGARKLVTKALGPTKERYKAIAEKIAPEFLERGVSGWTGTSLKQLRAKAASEAAKAGRQVDAVLEQHAGQTIDTRPIIDALDTAKAAYIAPNATKTVTVGKGANATTEEVPIVLDQRVVNHLTSLQKALQDLGEQATVADVVAARRVWDRVVSQVGGYEHRSAGAIGVPLVEQTEAWAKREATKAIRQVLDQALPDLTAVNKEYHFWKSLKDIVSQTMKRQAPQKGGLGKTILTAAGMSAGAASGHGPADRFEKMLTYGVVANRLSAAIRSPRWKFVGAKAKQDLADAIASGHIGRLEWATSRVTAALGAKVTTQ